MNDSNYEERTKRELLYFVFHGKEVLEKRVKVHGAHSRVGMLYLPKSWIGKKVKIVRMQ
jgi:putative transposon-encoded protein